MMDLVDIKYLIKHHKELAFGQKTVREESDEWFYYMHVPKSGGTSLRYALYDEFGAVATYPNLVDYYWRQKGGYVPKQVFYNEPRSYFDDSKRLLIGHYGLFPLTLRTAKPRVFTILRHPVARVISAINYHSEKGRRFYGMPNSDVIEACKRIECSRIQESIGYKLDHFCSKTINSKLDSIEVVGILEYLDQSISLLNFEFGWDLKLSSHRNKANQTRSFTDQEKKILKELCEGDIAIYELALQRFMSRM